MNPIPTSGCASDGNQSRACERRLWRQLAICAVVGLLPAISGLATATSPDVRLGLPPVPSAWSSPANQPVIRLGKQLFFDPQLSADQKVSCSKCHDPAKAFTDGRARAVGHDDHVGTRNAPTLLNAGFLDSFFWDGRAASLEAQARAPLFNPVEHAFATEGDLLNAIRRSPAYEQEFLRAFAVKPQQISVGLVARALSAYERTLIAGDSPFDRYLYGHNSRAMNAPAVRGLELFRGRAQCASCHTIGKRWSLLTDGEFHVSPMGLPVAVTENLGTLTSEVIAAAKSSDRGRPDRLIAINREVAALGRFVVTLDPKDIGKFKTPSLRNVALTAPYMHDGSVATLDEAVNQELYSRRKALNYPIALTIEEKQDLVAFLQALTSPYAQDGSASSSAGENERSGGDLVR